MERFASDERKIQRKKKTLPMLSELDSSLPILFSYAVVFWGTHWGFGRGASRQNFRYSEVKNIFCSNSFKCFERLCIPYVKEILGIQWRNSRENFEIYVLFYRGADIASPPTDSVLCVTKKCNPFLVEWLNITNPFFYNRTKLQFFLLLQAMKKF